MQIAWLRSFLADGLIDEVVVRSPGFCGHVGWTVECRGRFGNADPLLRSARREVREFKSLDTVSRSLAAWGCRDFRVLI